MSGKGATFYVILKKFILLKELLPIGAEFCPHWGAKPNSNFSLHESRNPNTHLKPTHRYLDNEGDAIDLLSEEWRCCDAAILENGCFFVFWGTNNAGGPCLFVPDEPWVPLELRARLEELVAADGT